MVSENPEKTQTQANKCLLLTPFALIRCTFDLVSAGGLWKQKRMKACLLYREHTKRDTPPYCGATSALYPHNFSHHKNRKKFAQEDIVFRTENTAKSQPTFGWKNFRKFFRGNVSGAKEIPPILRRGGEVLKYERLVYVCKDSGIIRECKRRVLSFCFRTKEPF